MRNAFSLLLMLLVLRVMMPDLYEAVYGLLLQVIDAMSASMNSSRTLLYR